MAGLQGCIVAVIAPGVAFALHRLGVWGAGCLRRGDGRWGGHMRDRNL